MLRVYAQSHRRHRTDHRLCVFNASGATVHRYRGRIICTMLKCPPRKEALRACRCAGCLIVIVRRETVSHKPRSRAPVLSVFPLSIVVRCWPFELSTVLAASRACGDWPKTATLDTAARGAGWDRPTALAVSG